MAEIHGSTQCEKTVLRRCPDFIENFEDIEFKSNDFKKKLSEERTKFSDNLPNEISNHKKILDELKSEKTKTEETYDEKIDNARTRLKYFYLKKIRKPIAIRKHRKIIQIKEKEIERLNNEPDTVFDEMNEELLRNIETLNNVKQSIEYSSAYGEQAALKELRKLEDGYHVFCDVGIKLSDYVRYKGERNLGSAQMDFVVVGKKGIFVIEVKNWSNEYLRNYRGFTPHEQVDRAGMVLYIHLSNYLPFKPRVGNLLLSIQNNLRYDPNYKFVSVMGLDYLNRHISSRNQLLSNSEIEDVVSALKRIL